MKPSERRTHVGCAVAFLLCLSAHCAFAARPLVVTQTQFYPLRDMSRGYMGRFADLPLAIDPTLPTEKGPRASHNFTIAELDLTLKDVLSYGLDGVSYFPSRCHECLYNAPFVTATNAVTVPILGFWPAQRKQDENLLAETLKDPRACRVNGKVLVLSYWTQKFTTPTELRDRLVQLRAKHGDTFVVLPDIQKIASHKYRNTFRTKGELSADQIDEIKGMFRDYAAAADGIYLGETHMLTRPTGGDTPFDAAYYRRVIGLAREVLGEPAFAGRKLLALSAINGHENPATIGRNVSSDGTRTLRASLSAALEAKPDVIVLPEWDEYNENTAFAPTLCNASAVRRIVRHLLGKPPLQESRNVPNLVVTYRKMLSPGEPFYVEVLNVPDGVFAGKISCVVEVTNERGERLAGTRFKDLSAESLCEARQTWMTSAWSSRARALVVRAAWRTDDGRKGMVSQGLHPVDFAPANSWNVRVVKQPIRDIASVAASNLAFDNGILSADLSAAEPLRFAFVRANGEIAAIAGDRNRAPHPFETTDSERAFEISVYSQKTFLSKVNAFRIADAESAAWMRFPWDAPTKGGAFRMPWLATGTEPCYLRLSAAEMSDAKFTIDFPGVMSESIALADVWRKGLYVFGATNGLQVSIARLDRPSTFPAPLERTSCSLRCRPDFNRLSSVAWIEAVTMNGKIWRSRPFVRERNVADRQIALRYDFAPTHGDAVMPITGERRFCGILGGACSLVSGFNRQSIFSGALPIQSGMNLDADRRPQRILEPDGTWSLAFDGVDDYAALPWDVVPLWGDFSLSFEVCPSRNGDREGILAARQPSGSGGNLWAVTLTDRLLAVEYVSLEGVEGCLPGKDPWTQVRTVFLEPNVWHRVTISRRGTQMMVTAGGKSFFGTVGVAGGRSSMLTMGMCPTARPFAGKIRSFSLSSDSATSASPQQRLNGVN